VRCKSKHEDQRDCYAPPDFSVDYASVHSLAEGARYDSCHLRRLGDLHTHLGKVDIHGRLREAALLLLPPLLLLDAALLLVEQLLELALTRRDRIRVDALGPGGFDGGLDGRDVAVEVGGRARVRDLDLGQLGECERGRLGRVRGGARARARVWVRVRV